MMSPKYYKLDDGKIVRTGTDPDKCYEVHPRNLSYVWAGFHQVIKHRLKNNTARQATSDELKQLLRI